jgi:hypothetical protein
MIGDLFQNLLSSSRLGDFLLRQDDERLSVTIAVTRRHAKDCCDMLKMLLSWESHYSEEVLAAVEDFAPKCEFATLELRKHLPEWTPEAHAEGLLPATEGTIRKEHEHSVACLTSCVEFARVWFDVLL